MFATTSRRAAGLDLWELSGPAGACTVVPGAGSQLAALALRPTGANPESAPVEVLWGPPAEAIRQVGWGGGAPILFPFPGRIADGAYTHRERSFRIPGGGGHGRHPLHGFVGLAPWSTVDSGADGESAWVSTAVEHADLNVPEEAFPGAYRLEVTHRLGRQGYRHEIEVVNIGDEPFPFGYGWHPYFRAPLVAGGQRGECVLRLPASARWELAADLIPTGRRLEVGGPYDLRAGSPLADKSYDDPFTLLAADPDGGSHAELLDPACGLRLVVGADGAFGHWVVYSPRTMSAVAIEPYTCAPDAFNLERRGVPAGLRELAPGERWRGCIRVGLQQA